MPNKKPEFTTTIITPVFRLSYPHVWETTFNQLAKRDEYSIQMLFDKATAKNDLAIMVKLVNDLIAWKGWAKAAGIMKPWIDGDTKVDSAGVPWVEKNPAYKGQIILKSWSKQAPGIVDPTGKHPILQHDEIYGGCYCRAQLNAYAYEKGQNRGVSFGLIHIQKIKDGVAFGNRGKVEDAFSPVEGGAEAVDTELGF